MPLKKIVFKPGVNRENTRYTTEGGFYESEKIRFRQGTPEVIGGWERISPNTFLGICRSLWNWVTLAAKNLIGVGTNLKFYIEAGGSYFDQTPVREVHSLGLNPFTTTSGFNVVAVYDANPSGISSGQFIVGDFVTFFNTAAVGGINLNSNYATTTGNYQTQAPVAAVTGSISGTVLTVTALSSGVIINGAAVTGTGVAAGTVITSFGSGAGGTGTYNVNVSQTVASVSMSITAPGLVATYFVTAATPATSSATGGGATVVAQYEINTGAAISVPITGWGGGPWGGGGWGSGLSSINPLRIWNQTNFGQDLIFGPRGGNIYYWNAQIGYEPYKLPGGAISGSPGTALITDASFAVPNLTAIRFECDGGLLPAGISNDAVYYV